MQRSFLRETAGVVMRAVVVVLTIVIVVFAISSLFESELGISDGNCNIAVLPIEGAILPYHGIGDFELITTPESVESYLRAVEDDPDILGILVEINSPGGTPVASARIAERFRSTNLPVVGLVGDMAASGGYMIAAATDYLIASPMSDVGSIGVNMSYVEESAKNEEEGLTYVQLTTGKFKDTGSPNRPITDEERELLLADLQIIHDEFVGMVATYRDLDRMDVEAIADGSSMPGARAISAGLIDALGGRTEAQEAFANILEIDPAYVQFCEYDQWVLPF
ncbi:MAG: signal peptide peptidase SppA [Candidatus Kaiserbacteria bacterium]|nr:signal peptide peptidase SppA [Candidatus Kaiserbacteria bacterium]MCB9815984.1 signal peptide peptidase SppA [Candidatus Nomurabacteria bacterium]